MPVSGVIEQANRLRELGYRYRLYLFPGQEHYGPPIVDQWADGAPLRAPVRARPEPAAA